MALKKTTTKRITCSETVHWTLSLTFWIAFFSSDKEAEKDFKLAKLQDKRNAIMLVLRNGSEKLENLRARGAPNDLQEVKEQQNIVKVKTRARKSLCNCDVKKIDMNAKRFPLELRKSNTPVICTSLVCRFRLPSGRNFVDDEQVSWHC